MQGHPEEVYACEFLDQSHLLTASADRLFLWDMELGTCVQEATCMPGPLDQGKLSSALTVEISNVMLAHGIILPSDCKV